MHMEANSRNLTIQAYLVKNRRVSSNLSLPVCVKGSKREKLRIKKSVKI